MLYHVSNTAGIKVLKPRVSTHGRAYVYAIDNLVKGLLFGVRHDDFDLFIYTDREGNNPTCCECYPGALERVYKGKSCSVYELPEDGFLHGMTSWTPEVVCEHEVAVEREIPVPDIYGRLLEEEQKGTLVIRRFENSAEYKKMISTHIVDRLIRFDAIKYIETDARFQKYFKDIIEALQGAMDGHLLCPERTIKSMEEKYLQSSLELVEKVFTASEGEKEGKLVRSLVEEIRRKKYYVPELELIMVDETDAPVGYVMFSRFHIEGKYEEKFLMLSPVAVKTELQRKHISKELIEYGFQKAKELGYEVVMVEGNPRNYNPRGFVTSAPYGIVAAPSVGLPAPECLMVKELVPGALENMHGVVEYSFYEALR